MISVKVDGPEQHTLIRFNPGHGKSVRQRARLRRARRVARDALGDEKEYISDSPQVNGITLYHPFCKHCHRYQGTHVGPELKCLFESTVFCDSLPPHEWIPKEQRR